ncbi:acyltransferase domain-containing protein [Spirillospora sp. CA-253888]
MIPESTVVLFPGQGAYRPGLLPALSEASPEAAAALEQVGAASGGVLEQLITAERGLSLDELSDLHPDCLQLGIFATCVTLWATHREACPDDAILMGHSLGEIAAFTCAGGYSIADGTRVVLARNAALTGLGTTDGGMAALGLDAERAEALLRLAGDPTAAIACRNAPSQTVVSGSDHALARVEALAGALRLSFTRLHAPFPFHSPRMTRAVAAYRSGITAIPQRLLTYRVYSPLLARFVGDDDDLAVLLADQFTAPVELMSAVRSLHARGARHFIECGVGRATVNLVSQTVPSIRTTTWDTDPAAQPSGVTGTEPAAAPATGTSGADTDRADTSPPTEPAAREPDGRSDTPELTEILQILRDLYAETLEYPIDAFEADADLEADLGIDSLKQTALLTRTAQRFGLPDDDEEVRVADHPTLEAVAATVRHRLTADRAGE